MKESRDARLRRAEPRIAVTDIIEIISISITATGNLLNKLKETDLIEPVYGQGKGKYKFITSKE